LPRGATGLALGVLLDDKLLMKKLISRRLIPVLFSQCLNRITGKNLEPIMRKLDTAVGSSSF
jgi:hypothetical protein